MFVRIALAALLTATLSADPLDAARQQEERPKVPNDSILVVITGCIKGRVIRAADVRQTDTTSGYNVRATTFRLAGKMDVMAAVKEQNGLRS